ncbi:MAG: hypothetical protein NVS9B4_17630 [Candidatus Acidiferrum sp.]
MQDWSDLENAVAQRTPKIVRALRYFQANWWKFLLTSVFLVIPCVWHRHIEAGDLPSHVYNSWLAQLIGQGRAPGLYLVNRWDNVLFDVALLYVAKLVGLPLAQKIVVAACVLVFFWGVFALLAVMTGRPPWPLLPCLAMLAYGYAFNMGFMNYYLSLGLASASLALLWRERGIDWLAGALLAPVTLLAHPIGFCWLLGTLAYVRVRAKLSRWWKTAPPVSALAVLVVVRWYLLHKARFEVAWRQEPFYFFNGADQVVLYGARYVWIGWAALTLGFIWAAAEVFQRRREASFWKPALLAGELYLLAFCATWLLPQDLRPALYAGWIGLLVSRLTVVSAVFGLAILGGFAPKKWAVAGFAICAAVFFVFLYQDTQKIDRLESHAERLVGGLPFGTRVIPAIEAPPDSRIPFISHVVDRACVEHCFVYSNYEPSSRQFRVRAQQGSPLVTASADDSGDMEGGSYEVRDSDPPLTLIYQCEQSDPWSLCMRELRSGDTTGRANLAQ